MNRVVLLLIAGLLAIPAFGKDLSTVQIKVTNLNGKQPRNEQHNNPVHASLLSYERPLTPMPSVSRA